MALFIIKIYTENSEDNTRIDSVLTSALRDFRYTAINSVDEIDPAQIGGAQLLFAVALGKYGVNSNYSRLLFKLRSETDLLKGCTSAILMDGDSEL